tara:strand:+ start:57 stop:866 length:810 start_codon:yes stop_codon:yes gene_type:complete
MAKKEVAKGPEVLRKLILTKIGDIRKQRFSSKAIDKFSVTFRVFLLRYLHLNYEFTLEEIIKELEKTKLVRELKEKIVTILTLLTEIKYEDKVISKEEFNRVLYQAEIVIGLLTRGITKQKKEGVEENHKHLFGFFHKISLGHKETEEKLAGKEQQQRKLEIERKKQELEKLQKEKPKLEQVKGFGRKEESILPPPTPMPEMTDKITLIREMVKDVKQMLAQSKLDHAKTAYIELMKIYTRLEPEQQVKVYESIKQVYFARKEKEKVLA